MALITADTVEYPIQVNGKVRGRVTVPVAADEATVRTTALAEPRVVDWLDGPTPKEVTVVPGRMVNIVV